MLRYIEEFTGLGLQEIPGEICLNISLSGCGHHCEGCHSPEFQNKDNGIELTEKIINDLLVKYSRKISCVCFFSGEHDINNLLHHAKYIKSYGYKLALYSGYDLDWFDNVPIKSIFDYIKVGDYRKDLGGLDSPNTNQKLYQIINNIDMIDITSKFWREA